MSTDRQWHRREQRILLLSGSAQTGFGARGDFFAMCRGPWLTTHLNLVPRLRMSGEISQFPHAFEVCMGQLHLYFYKMSARFYVNFFSKWKLFTKYY